MAHEKKPNQPVTLVTTEPLEDFADLEPDADLFGTDDLIGIDELVAPGDKETA